MALSPSPPPSSPGFQERLLRAGSLALAAVMALMLARFFGQPDTLRSFTVPLTVLFALFGWWRPSVGLYPLIFTLPLLVLAPHVQGVGNFSLVEIAWWALCIGRLGRRGLRPRTAAGPPLEPWPLLRVLTVVVCGSAMVRLMRSHLWSDPIIWQLVWDRLPDFFRWRHGLTLGDPRLYPLRAMVVWLEGVALLTLVRHHAPREEFQRRVRILLTLGLAVTAGVSAHQFFGGLFGSDSRLLTEWQLEIDWLPRWLTDHWPGLRAIHGPWPDVNSFASYLLMTLPVVMSAFVLVRNVFGRGLLLLLGIADVMALMMSCSRIAWLWLPVVVVVWVALSRARTRRLTQWLDRGGRRWVLVGFAVLLGVVGTITISDRGVAGVRRLTEIPAVERFNVILKGRVTLWRRGLEMAHDSPLLGVGWGSFYEQSFLYQDSSAGVTSWGEGVWNPEMENAHNQYLQILTETGLLGFALAALLMGQWLRVALCAAAWGHGGRRWAVRGYLAGILALSGTLLTGHALLLTEMLFLLWVFIGLALVTPRGPHRVLLASHPAIWRVALVAVVLVFAGRAWTSRGAPELIHHGTGFYPPTTEPNTGILFQWTSGQTSMLLRNLRGECALYLSNARPDQEPVPVEILINGEMRERVVLTDFHWWPHRYPIDLPLNTVYRVDLRVLRTYHNDFDPPDRFLGARMFIERY